MRACGVEGEYWGCVMEVACCSSALSSALVAHPGPDVCVGELITMHSEALKLRMEGVTMHMRGCRMYTELACASETVGLKQPCLLSFVSLEIGDIAHSHFSPCYGPQHMHLCHKHLLVPLEECIQGTADTPEVKVGLYCKREGSRQNLSWTYL
jgi:hypothetical protein